MKIKICGMRQERNIAEILTLRPDYLGLIFVKSSPRFVSKVISKQLLQELRGNCKIIGVFQNSSIDSIAKIQSQYGLDGIQLHGEEPPEFCEQLGLSLPEAQIWKVFTAASSINLLVNEYTESVDGILFDSSKTGGSGKKFEWNTLEGLVVNKPVLLSGGIGPDDVESLKSIFTKLPWLTGIDINSKFETTPGHKDASLLKTFIGKIRS